MKAPALNRGLPQPTRAGINLFFDLPGFPEVCCIHVWLKPVKFNNGKEQL